MKIEQLLYTLGQAHGGLYDEETRLILADLIKRNDFNGEYLEILRDYLDEILKRARE